MTANEIPSEMLAMIRKKFEEEPKIKGMRTQQFLFQKKGDYEAALNIGKMIAVVFGDVVQSYLDEVNSVCVQIDFSDLDIPAKDKEEISILNITMFIAIDIVESCLNDINETLHRTDRTLNYEIHNDLRNLSEAVRVKMKYLSENSEYLNDSAWGDKCDNMYEMMKNKAKSIIRKRKSGNWGRNKD